MTRLYEIVLEQARSNFEWNRIRHGRNNDFVKILPSGKDYSMDDLPFLPLQRLLHLFLTKDSQFNLQFVQLFESSNFEELESNYQNNVAQQFIMTRQRYGGLINDKTPCLINSSILWIPSERKTNRTMTNDERLYLNVVLLYNGLGKNLLARKTSWFLKQINDNEKENIQLEILHGK